jgi:hypothetical protein
MIVFTSPVLEELPGFVGWCDYLWIRVWRTWTLPPSTGSFNHSRYFTTAQRARQSNSLNEYLNTFVSRILNNPISNY